MGASICAAPAPQQIRIGDRFVLAGNTRPSVANGLAHQHGRLPGNYQMPRMLIHFKPTAAQQTDLNHFLTALQDRHSPQFHKFLTPEQYAARFGAHPTDIARVSAWLEESGFRNIEVARGGGWISFNGTAAQAESAFNVTLNHYALNGEEHFSNAADPQLPKAFEGLVSSIHGLHNFALKSHAKRSHPNFTSSISGSHYLAPDDWATIYNLQPLYGSGIDGTGVTIAVVGQSDIALTDLQAFRAAAGLPAKDPTIVIPPGSRDPGLQSQSGDESEADLDLEWAGGIARNANILFVTSANGVFDSVNYVVNNNSASIMTISYGLCEADDSNSFITSEEAIFQQAAAQGITILASSGDAGAADCDSHLTETAATLGLAVEYPASSQYVTAVGGTEFTEYSGQWGLTNNSYGGSALFYLPEEAWNDGFQSSTGGGVSALFPKPTWQVGSGVPNDNARDLPDVAFTASPAHDGYLICNQGSCVNGFRAANNSLQVIGGTSASAPSFAGLLALVMQKGGGNRLGNINPNLYSLAQISQNAFHDVYYSGNQQACQSGSPNCPNGGTLGYSAGNGYDLATGLGSVDGYNFAQEWFGDFSLVLSPTSITLKPGTSQTIAINVGPQNHFSGNVTFTCSVASTLVDVTCSLPSTAINTSGTTTLTITAASTAQTPIWKHFPSVPPRTFLLIALLLLLAIGLMFIIRSRRVPVYAFGTVSFLIMATVIVSCGGGGGSSGFSGSNNTPAPALSLSCAFPTSVTVGTTFVANCVAVGGTAPYAYSISSGALPPGISLSPTNGGMTGVPTAYGTDSFTVKVTDSSSPTQTATQVISSLAVNPGPLQVSCILPIAVVGIPYNGGCTATGGVTPYNFSLASPLPAGLTLNASTGAITGTLQSIQAPFHIGLLSQFYLTVSDSESPAKVASAGGQFAVSDDPTLGNNSLPAFCTSGLSGNLGSPVTFGQCVAYNGKPPYSYSLSGSVPPGIIIDPTTGYLRGTPTAIGTYSFSMKALDSSSPPLSASFSPVAFLVRARLPETGLVTITAASGGIVNQTTVSVFVPQAQ